MQCLLCKIEDDDDANSDVVQPNSVVEHHRPKLLFFKENRRPPYWGTWRKRSISIKARRPFAKDTVSTNLESILMLEGYTEVQKDPKRPFHRTNNYFCHYMFKQVLLFQL